MILSNRMNVRIKFINESKDLRVSVEQEKNLDQLKSVRAGKMISIIFLGFDSTGERDRIDIGILSTEKCTTRIRSKCRERLFSNVTLDHRDSFCGF